MTILNGCLGYMPTPESPGRGPAMIMGSTAMHDSASIDDKLFIMLLLLRYYLLLFFCRAQTIYSMFNQVSSSVWKAKSKNVPWWL